MNPVNEVVTYEDLLSFQDSALVKAAKAAAAKGEVLVADEMDTAKPKGGIIVVAKFAAKPKLTKGQRIAAKRQAEQEAAIDATLCKGHFGEPKSLPMTADRAGMHMASLRLEQRSGSRKVRRQFRRLGLSSLTLARRELGLPKSATRDEVLAVLDKYVP